MTGTVTSSIVVLISGSGSNLQALIDTATHRQQFFIASVISNRPDAFGLVRAEKAGIPAHCVDHRTFPDRDSFEAALIEQIDAYSPGLLVLAGFMRILTPEFVQYYRGRAINIHPSLLPRYRGLHTHQRALQAGDKTHGCSVHFVTEELDGGPVIIQSEVPVLADDTEDSLAQRVLKNEHIIYPMVVDWYTQGRLRLVNNSVEFDGQPLKKALLLQEIANVQHPATA
jgi:phosphoribosylglycinamide formyltransferase-1